LINIKNEKTNFHRILSGLLDVHSFYIKKSNTQMCSYVNDWNFINVGFNYVKFLIEKVCIFITYIFIFIKNNITDEQKDSFLFKLFSKIFQDIFILILETYCL
jgi:hypothetical protein